MIKLERLISVDELIVQAKIQRQKELDLSYCALQIIPDEVFDLTHLEVLKLIGNKLTYLPKEIKSLTHLTHLYLSKNRIKDIDDDIIDGFRYVECLDLGENPIRYNENRLADIFRRNDSWKGYKLILKNIQEAKEKRSKYLWLSLPDNLEVLPREIFDLVELEELQISGGNIREIPLGISELKNLRHLDLRYNHLVELPTDLDELQNLETIDLVGNDFSTFPKVILRLEKLKRLDISHNKIEKFEDKVFDMPNLESFYAIDNPFEHIDSYIFSHYSYSELKSFFRKE